MKYDKLVRDNIIPLLQQKRMDISFHVAQPDEYWKKLKEKLQEEVDEFIKSEESEELADILEVIHALVLAKGLQFDHVERVRELKKKDRGGFHKQYILEEVKESSR